MSPLIFRLSFGVDHLADATSRAANVLLAEVKRHLTQLLLARLQTLSNRNGDDDDDDGGGVEGGGPSASF